MSNSFVYTIDYSGLGPPNLTAFTGTNSTDIANNYVPIINDNNCFTSILFTPIFDGSIATITIIFTYIDDGTSNDGLSFNNVNGYYNGFNSITITEFGGIPLSRGGNQFANLNGIVFTATDTPNILTNTSLAACFINCSNFNSDISGWDTTNVISMNSTFTAAGVFNQPLGTWNTSNVTDMNGLFAFASSFNHPIGTWNTSNVTNMQYVFYYATAFNQNISYDSNNNYWNTSNVENMYQMFFGATAFNQPIGTWNTGNVRAMNTMFQNATAFNQPIGSWNTSMVTNMERMFYGATAFNQNLSYHSSNNYWNTSNVQNMNGIFYNTSNFNNGAETGDITHPMNWIVSQFNTTPSLFSVGSNLTFLGTQHNSPFSNNGYLPDNRYQIEIVVDGSSVFTGGFYVNGVNLITSFFDNINPTNNILMTDGLNGADGIYPETSTNISSIPALDSIYGATEWQLFIGNSLSSLSYYSSGNWIQITDPVNFIISDPIEETITITIDGSSVPVYSTYYSPILLNSVDVVATPSDPSANTIVTGNTGLVAGNNMIDIVLSSNTYSQTFYISVYNPSKPIICFLEGSKILCFIDKKEVYVPIENIGRGTLVKTSLNGYKMVDMIGHSKMYNPGNSLHSKNRLYKCSPKNYPELSEDLIITGCHSILVDELTDEQCERSIEYTGKIYVTEKKYRLISCLDPRAEPYTEEGIHTIWHLALENNNYYMNYGIYANGLLVETTSKRMMKELSGMELV
jgi:surface protein